MTVEAGVNIKGRYADWLYGFSEFEADLYGPNVFTLDLSIREVWAVAYPANGECLGS